MVEGLLEVHNNFPKKSQKGIYQYFPPKKFQKKFQKVQDVSKVPDHVTGIQLNHVFPHSKKHQFRNPHLSKQC
jgi:hypothetical protein